MIHFGNITAQESLGLPLKEIEQRKHNLWIGISLGNKLFTPEYIQALILFALKFTKEKVLVWIPGKMYSTNYYYFEKLSRARSLRKAFADEDAMKLVVGKIIAMLSPADQKRIHVVNFDDTNTPEYIRQNEVLQREFSQEGEFYSDVLDIVRENVIARKRTPTKHRLESLALYILQELPMFLCGIKSIDAPTLYNVILYPGLGKIDYLTEKIKKDPVYIGLRLKLKIKTEAGIVGMSLLENK